VVGAPIEFSAKAWGLKKELIIANRFLWSFGDGSSSENQKVSHVYSHPGKYVLVVDAQSGEYSASDRMTISVVPSELIISNVVTGTSGFIEVFNNSQYELDLSHWMLQSNKKYFVLPLHTIILPKTKIIFPTNIIKLDITNDTQLLYPNGEVAYDFIKNQNQVKEATIQTSDNKLIQNSNADQPKISSEPSSVKESKQNVAAVVNTQVFENNSDDQSEPVKNKENTSKWIWILIGISVIASASILFAKKTKINNEADEYKIIE